MTLQDRVEKLEKTDPASDDVPDIGFVVFIEDDQTTTPEFSVIVGRPDLQMNRHEVETADDFYRRAYAVKAGGKHVEDMTSKERRPAYESTTKLVTGHRVRTFQPDTEPAGTSQKRNPSPPRPAYMSRERMLRNFRNRTTSLTGTGRPSGPASRSAPNSLKRRKAREQAKLASWKRLLAEICSARPQTAAHSCRRFHQTLHIAALSCTLSTQS